MECSVAARKQSASDALERGTHVRRSNMIGMLDEAYVRLISDLAGCAGFDVDDSWLPAMLNTNLLHLLAWEGAVHSVEKLTRLASQSSAEARAMLDAFAERDSFGRTPLHIAGALFGTGAG